MQRLARIVLFACLGVACAAQPATVFTGRVVAALDGDSMRILRDGREVEVRLHGVDAPEGRQAYGDEARAYLRERLVGKVVDVEVRDVDQYGRLVARLGLDGADVGLDVIRSGHGWHYVRYSNDPAYAAAERDARARRLGLWQDPSPQPPWEFREQTGRAGRASPSERSSPAPQGRTGTSAPRPTGPFHGNVQSHVFHAPGCPDYRCKACTAEFATEDEAIAAGYRPHRECVRR